MASFSPRLGVIPGVPTVVLACLLACSSPKMPSGPSPEYEEPPAPSWVKSGTYGPSDGGAAAPQAPSVLDQILEPGTPSPGGDGGDGGTSSGS